MPDIEPPNLGEVLRRLDSLQVSIADLIAEMKADRAENARIYVRADVYNVAQTAQNAIVADLHRDVGAVDTNWRAEVAALSTSFDGRIAAVKASADAKFGVIENDRKSDVAWRRQVTLAVGGIAVTVLLSIAGFIITLTR